MKYIYLFIALFFTHVSFADAWDNLTYEEAEAVVAELEKNPFIFDYCDCCDNSGQYATNIQLLKVVQTEIVTCEWDDTFYSVRAESIVLANVFYADSGPDIQKLSSTTEVDASPIIYMNYTWTLHPERKIATPFFNVVKYNYYGEDKKPCKDEFAYPTPAQVKSISKDKKYKKWYKKVM